jgi:hypothetical protein
MADQSVSNTARHEEEAFHIIMNIEYILRTFSEKGCLNQSEEMNPQTQGKAFIPWM